MTHLAVSVTDPPARTATVEQTEAMTAGQPLTEVAVPASVSVLAAGSSVRLAWQNEVGGLTFELDGPAERRFVKWTPPSSGIDLAQEVVRLGWAAGFISVPHVLSQGSDEDGAWFVTSALSGSNAVTSRWRADPAQAVQAIGAGLRTLHDALPVLACPFRWSAEDRVRKAQRRAGEGRLQPARWHDVHSALSVTRALQIAADPPSIDRLVVCHGDACAPNTLLDEDGSCTGHVDLGQLGVADRWADLAIATWSTEWNYGPGWESALLHAYGVDADPERTAYYRLLWDLGA